MGWKQVEQGFSSLFLAKFDDFSKLSTPSRSATKYNRILFHEYYFALYFELFSSTYNKPTKKVRRGNQFLQDAFQLKISNSY